MCDHETSRDGDTLPNLCITQADASGERREEDKANEEHEGDEVGCLAEGGEGEERDV